MARIERWFVLLVGVTAGAPAWGNAASGEPAAIVSALPNPSAALARYLASGSQTASWQMASVEVEASIPRLGKRGRLSAIRRLLPIGGPEYQVLETDGDRTVRQQVIARYLSADAEAAALPAASVAITPANYRFRYLGVVAAGVPAYAFEIAPRRKRAGLLRGQLWIDASTGIGRRLTGYLVKSPSVFVRRINITRDTLVCDGMAYERTTHVEIDTRLIGRAELTITERPYDSSSAGKIRAGSPELAMQHAEGR